MHHQAHINVMIVDDHPMFRSGLHTMLDRDPQLTVIGEATNGMDAIAMADQLLPDVVVVDINMPGMSGIQLTRSLKQRHPLVAIVVMTVDGFDDYLFQAVRAGAAAFCLKHADPEIIIDMIHQVARGTFPINDLVITNPRVATQVMDEFLGIGHRTSIATSEFFSLITPREMEVLDLVSQGRMYREIADDLGISGQTVKNHVTSILRKLHVNDRLQAVMYAVRHGWTNADGDRIGGDALPPS